MQNRTSLFDGSIQVIHHPSYSHTAPNTRHWHPSCQGWHHCSVHSSISFLMSPATFDSLPVVLCLWMAVSWLDGQSCLGLGKQFHVFCVSVFCKEIWPRLDGSAPSSTQSCLLDLISRPILKVGNTKSTMTKNWQWEHFVTQSSVLPQTLKFKEACE